MGFSRVTLIFLIGFLLSTFTLKPEFRPKKKLTIIKSSALLNSYLTGNKSKLSKDLKEAHKVLGITHWLTPSGIHLTLIFFMFGLIWKSSRLKTSLSFLLCFILLFTDNFSSVERMAWFYLSQNYTKRSDYSFWLSAFVCLINGNFSSSPVSYFLSYSFLSIFIFSSNLYFSNIFRLYFIQLIVQLSFDNEFYPIGVLFNFLFTPFSAFIIPTLSIPTFDSIFQDFLINVSKMPIVSYKLTLLPAIYILLSVFILRWLKWNSLALIILTTLFLLKPQNIYNFDKEKLRSGFSSPPPKEFIKLKHHKKRVISYHPFGIRCSNRFVGLGWSTHCRQY